MHSHNAPDARPIVVGVDGSDGSAAAIRYAADRAYSSGRRLRLVHVAPAMIPTAGMTPFGAPPYMPQEADDPAFTAAGRAVLADSVAFARALIAEDQLESEFVTGARPHGVLRCARDASEIVLGEDRTPLLERVSLGSMVAAVAAHSAVPVTCVPETWRAASVDRVCVGIHDYHDISEDLIRAAFAAADGPGSEVEFVHVWDLPPAYGTFIGSVMDMPRWQRMVKTLIAQAVDRTMGPGHDFALTVTYGHPAQVLRDRSRDASLLLLAHHRSGHLFEHVGGVARALLRTSDCPVVVHPISHPAVTGAVPERLMPGALERG